MSTQPWITPVVGPDFLHDVVESVKAQFNIDSKRVSLFGHAGRGGIGSLPAPIKAGMLKLRSNKR